MGSSSYITDKNGEVIQHTEYMAFGEVLVDEHSTSNKMPYLFNGKELDYETGLYYYGARYYDPKTSIFLNVDPLVEKTMSPYAYVNNNPVNLIDPTGMESEGWGLKDNKWEWKSDLTEENYKELGYSDYRNDGSVLSNVSIIGKENENTGLTYLGYEGYTSYISHSNATISLWDGDRGFLGNWANSDNFLGKISYNIANNFYLAAQVVDFDLLGKNHINPMTGSRAYTNIDGTPQYNAGDRAFAFASVFNPISPKFIPKSDLKISKEILTPLTASQFSKTFKGTFLAKAPPSVRGYINRKINFILDKLNNVNTAKSSVVGTSKLIKGTNKNEKD